MATYRASQAASVATTGAGTYQVALSVVAGEDKPILRGSLQIMCPAGTAASLDYSVQRSLVPAPGTAQDSADWTEIATGTVAAAASAIVNLPADALSRGVRLRVRRNGAGAESAFIAYIDTAFDK